MFSDLAGELGGTLIAITPLSLRGNILTQIPSASQVNVDP